MPASWHLGLDGHAGGRGHVLAYPIKIREKIGWTAVKTRKQTIR